MKTKTNPMHTYPNIRRLSFLTGIACIAHTLAYGGVLYVDSGWGNDTNPGTFDAPVASIHQAMNLVQSANNNYFTIKINPGIYPLQSYVDVQTDKDLTNRRIVIEASYLPGGEGWTAEKMPVIVSIGAKGEVPGGGSSFVTAFLINSSNVTIRGLKFAGYPHSPNVRSFGVARLNYQVSDLLVEQCMFVGEENAANLQSGIIAHGDAIKINHCVFYKPRNAVVYWHAAAEKTTTSNNSFTNNLVYGVAQAAIWTCTPDENFTFKNNIVANTKYVWMLLSSNNKSVYEIKNSILVNNSHIEGIARKPGEFNLNLSKVQTDGDIELTLIEVVDYPLPNNFLHVKPGTLGSDLNAGLFMADEKLGLQQE